MGLCVHSASSQIHQSLPGQVSSSHVSDCLKQKQVVGTKKKMSEDPQQGKTKRRDTRNPYGLKPKVNLEIGSGLTVEGAGALGRWTTHSKMTDLKDPKEALRMS